MDVSDSVTIRCLISVNTFLFCLCRQNHAFFFFEKHFKCVKMAEMFLKRFNRELNVFHQVLFTVTLSTKGQK